MSQKTTQLNLVVVRSLDPGSTVAFYQRLGLSFQQEKHGNGPVHWSSKMGNLIFEVYPASGDNELTSRHRELPWSRPVDSFGVVERWKDHGLWKGWRSGGTAKAIWYLN